MSQYEVFFNVNSWNSDYYVAKWGKDLVSLHFPVESLKYSMRQYKHIEGDNFQLVENGELIDEKTQFSRDKQGIVLTINNMGNEHFRTSYPKK